MKRMFQRCFYQRVGVALLPLLLMFTTDAYAASVIISPVQVSLHNTAPIGLLRLTNTGTKPVSFQVRMYKGGLTKQDKPTTKELMYTPPIFKLGPGQAQIVRVGMRKRSHLTENQEYTLSIIEIPPPVSEQIVAGEGMMSNRLTLSYKFNIGVTVYAQRNLPSRTKAEQKRAR